MLGKGGFAKCYEVVDSVTNEILAGKIIEKASVVKPKARAKLETELKIHSSLRHKHIVRFEHCFEDEANVYILLELCKNQTLMEMVKKRKRMTEIETQYFMTQILSAVQYMHANRVIHRDLKLGNLFLNENLEIKIGDFGLAAQLAQDDERKRTICGTPNYIAPEILDGKNGHSYEVDVWSIGVILYTLLIGKPPFETSDVKTTYKRIRSNIYSFPEGVEISDSAKMLIRRILHTDPRARPTVTQILEDPFFYQCTIPRALPASALTAVPNFAVLKFVPQSVTLAVAEQSQKPVVQVHDDHAVSASQLHFSSTTFIPVGIVSAPQFMPPSFAAAPSPFSPSGRAPLSHVSSNTSEAVSLSLTNGKEPAHRPGFKSGLQPPSSDSTPRSFYPSSDRPLTASSGSQHSAPSMGLTGARPSTAIPAPSSRTYAGMHAAHSTAPHTGVPTSTLRSSALPTASSVPTASSTNGASKARYPTPMTKAEPLTSSRENYYGHAQPTAHKQQHDHEMMELEEPPMSARTQASARHPTPSTPTLRQPARRLPSPSSSTTGGTLAPSPKTATGVALSNAASVIQQQRPASAASPSTGSQGLMKLTSPLSMGGSGTPQSTSHHSLRAGSPSPSASRHSSSSTPSTTHSLSHRLTTPPSSQQAHPTLPLAPAHSTTTSTMVSSALGGQRAMGGTRMVDMQPSAQFTQQASQDVKMEMSSPAREPLSTRASMDVSPPRATVAPLPSPAKPSAGASSSAAPAHMEDPDEDEDHGNLTNMHHQLAASFAVQGDDFLARVDPATLAGPTLWVSRFVDFSSKYGLAYRVNDGNIGAHFNDSSKMMLFVRSGEVIYMERKKTSAGVSYDETSRMTIAHFPEHMKKKITLLKIFKDHLDKMGLSAGENHSRFTTTSPDQPFVYVKRWLRTKHAVIFRLSNKAVQVCFLDNSQIILSSEARLVTYQTPEGERSTHAISEVVAPGSAHLDIAKRLKYTKDILYQLINRNNRF